MPSHIDINVPANEGVLSYLQTSTGRTYSPDDQCFSCPPESVRDPYYTLGTHPDAVERLWNELTVELTVSCNWIVCATPTLVRPDTGVIFGFARGVFTYGLRLPRLERQELLAAAHEQALSRAEDLSGADRERYIAAQTGSVWTYSDGTVFDIRTLGEDWAFGRFLPDESHWCLAAYRYAV